MTEARVFAVAVKSILFLVTLLEASTGHEELVGSLALAGDGGT